MPEHFFLVNLAWVWWYFNLTLTWTFQWLDSKLSDKAIVWLGNKSLLQGSLFIAIIVKIDLSEVKFLFEGPKQGAKARINFPATIWALSFSDENKTQAGFYERYLNTHGNISLLIFLIRLCFQIWTESYMWEQDFPKFWKIWSKIKRKNTQKLIYFRIWQACTFRNRLWQALPHYAW